MSGEVDEVAFQALLGDATSRDLLLRMVGEASLGQVVGGAAHQLRNSLNSILNGAWLLMERPEDGELRAKLLPVMTRSAQRMSEMLDLLDPPPEIRSESADLRVCVQQCLQLLREQTQHVEVECPEGPAIRVRAPLLEIRHLLLNLLSSHLACKPTHLQIALSQGAQGVELQLRNVAGARPIDESGLVFALQMRLAKSLGGSLECHQSDDVTTLRLAGAAHE